MKAPNSAKEYLSKVKLLEFQIKQKQRQIDDARMLQGSVRGFDYSGVKVQTSPKGDTNIELAVKIMTLEQELTERLYALQELRAKVMNQIEMLDDPLHVELLTLRYCNFESFEQIAVDMCLSYDWVRHLHGAALQAFQNKILKVDTPKHTETC